MPLDFQILWAVMELAFLVPAALVSFFRKRRHERCTKKTLGTLVAYNAFHVGEPATPIFEHEVHSTRYRGISTVSSSSFNKKHRIGDRVALYYNPRDPEDLYVPELDRAANIISGIFAFIAALVFVIFFVIAEANFK